MRRSFLMRDFFFWDCKQSFFFCFRVSFWPLTRGNRAGSSRNESDYSRRGAQTSFPASRLSQLREFRTTNSSFFNFVAINRKKKSWSYRAPVLINCQFSDYTMLWYGFCMSYRTTAFQFWIRSYNVSTIGSYLRLLIVRYQVSKYVARTEDRQSVISWVDTSNVSDRWSWLV